MSLPYRASDHGTLADDPEEDLRAEFSAGTWRYFPKDGTPW
jgi:hypothetical protein